MEDIGKVVTLINEKPYSDETYGMFLEALQEELIFQYEHNEMYKRFCDRKVFNPYCKISSVEDIPPIAVSVFKELGLQLNSIPKEDIKLTLQSSATSGVPSTIVVDKITAKRQAKVMVKVIQEFIGKERKPFLVMDIDPRSASGKLLGARFAAVTGYLNFASKVGYFLKADKNDVSYFDVEGIKQYISEIDKNQPVVVFGFTYILYSNVLKSIQAQNMKLKLPAGSKIIHIGGWKKLESEKISKELFNKQLADCFGIMPADMIDIYGFTEQMGLNYPDCECGCKHSSSYVDILVRDVVSREVLRPGETGMLEFITPIPHSYPGNAVLTDDMGVIVEGACPYGRPGKRFKIVGRLKKAEVRGCGDILSDKLSFRSDKAEVQGEENYLDVQFIKHEIVGLSNDPKAQLEDIIEKLNSRQLWLQSQPIDALIGLIGQVARKWAVDSNYQFLKDKGLFFLSNWCDTKNLSKIAEFGLRGNIYYSDNFHPFPTLDNHYLKANPRGLVCHWMAGNVQILGLFALVQSILTKNVNLLKVSAKDEGVFSTLLSAFENESFITEGGYTIYGNDLLKTIGVIHFSRNATSLGKIMSEKADVRIAWGGKDAVMSVAAYPARIDAETVIFGPKLSFSVIAKEELSSKQEAKKLARKVSVDISVFDQTGCASPHNLYIEAGGIISPKEFCEILAESMLKTELQLPKPQMSAEQIAAIHSARGVYDFKGNVIGSETLSWTILYSEDNELAAPIYSKVIMVHSVEHINDTLSHADENIQTIGLAAPFDKAIDYASRATALGVSRCPLIGRMLNFEMPWDGIILIDRLVKWNTLGGPLF
ncbi:MAG: acyl-CoA reductase [Bacteroidales bacterium]